MPSEFPSIAAARRFSIYLLLGLAGLLLGAILLVIFGVLPGLALWAAQICLWEGHCAVGTSRWGHVSSTEVSGWLAYAMGALYLAMAYLFGWLFVAKVFGWWRGRRRRKKDRVNGTPSSLPVHLAVLLYIVADALLARLIFRK